jgi:transcriptional regulator with XRE-family HTH domain
MEIGEKIKQLRTRRGLTQEELADRCELTKGYISQLERDLTSPSIATLIDLLETLGTNLTNFFSESEVEKIVFRNEDVFVKTFEDGYTINWIIPNAQKNMMEPILIELESYSETKPDNPHEGEEFGYVLSGIIYLHYGDEKYKVRKGESFYYKCKHNHFLSNPGKSTARVLWVSTPPYF